MVKAADGNIVCWGYDTFPQPTLPAPLTGPFRTVVNGMLYVCGLRANGTVACWNWAPPPATLNGKTVTKLAASADTVCALASDGTITCWWVAGCLMR